MSTENNANTADQVEFMGGHLVDRGPVEIRQFEAFLSVRMRKAIARQCQRFASTICG